MFLLSMELLMLLCLKLRIFVLHRALGCLWSAHVLDLQGLLTLSRCTMLRMATMLC